ncbi:MAG: hypothetical protein EZS28_055959, partial [Streblomastix strix]
MFIWKFIDCSELQELSVGFRTEISKVEEIANFVSKFGIIIEIVVIITTFTSFVVIILANVGIVVEDEAPGMNDDQAAFAFQ